MSFIHPCHSIISTLKHSTTNEKNNLMDQTWTIRIVYAWFVMDKFKNVVLFLDSFELFWALCNSNIMHLLCMKCNRVTSCYSNFRDIIENAQSREERNCFELFVVAHDLSKYVNYYVLHSSYRNIDCCCEQNIKHS